MNSKELVKVEIRIIDGGWQWMGKLSKADLTLLCAMADLMSDASMEGADD